MARRGFSWLSIVPATSRVRPHGAAGMGPHTHRGPAPSPPPTVLHHGRCPAIFPLFLAQFEVLVLGRGMAQGPGATMGQIRGWPRDPAEFFGVASLQRAGGKCPRALTPCCLLHRPFSEICTEAKQTGKGWDISMAFPAAWQRIYGQNGWGAVGRHLSLLHPTGNRKVRLSVGSGASCHLR